MTGSPPVDDASAVQEVQAPRDVDRDLAAAAVPPELVIVVRCQGMPQVAALHASCRNSVITSSNTRIVLGPNPTCRAHGVGGPEGVVRDGVCKA